MLADAVLKQTDMKNGEADVELQSVIVHETATGYAQCFREDVLNPRMGQIELEAIVFSEQVRLEWPDFELYEKLKRGEHFANPVVERQIL